ncbi:MAG: copper amine oxidase N-terminal domain-containing protein [Caloramator sp.]|nr:copper amine oxidase N-terminal domain-containing protein [Caloramator sp.]
MKNKKGIIIIILTLILTTISLSALAVTNNIYINGTKTSISLFTQSPSNLIFVSEDLITKMGDKIVRQGNSIIVKKGNKQLKFQEGKTVYWLNGKSKPLATKKVSGKTVPVYAIVKSINGKLYVPLSILQTELGYPVKISGSIVYVGKLPANTQTNNDNINKGHKLTGNNPIYDYWVQHPITLNDVKQFDVKTTPKMFFPELGTPAEDNDIRVFENNRGFKSGWVMPVLPINMFATDDWDKDRETLKKYLEMDDFDSWGAIKYSPSGIKAGWETMVLGVENKPGVDYTIWFRYYWYPFYNETTAFENQKINWIHPQVLRFYFPTKWQEIWENAIGRSETIYVGRIYKFDGREFMVDKTSGSFFFSVKGGKLDRNYWRVKEGLE